MSEAPPPCPVTGAPPRRRVQWLSAKVLAALWRYGAGIDVAGQLGGIERLGLWESPAGLLYFDPPVAGDRDFYRRFYGRTGMHERVGGPSTARGEFALAAAQLKPGDRILDVGCGEGGFRRYVPAADYTGLDPHFGGSRPEVLAETIETHAAAHPGAYDAVCAFQVIEHVPDPLGFARAMLRALRPGGRLLIGVPCWPSAMTAIPNFVLNAPPHHLTLWNRRALEALCARVGVRCRAVEPIPVTAELAIAYWMGRAAPKFRSGRLFAHAWSWHLGLAWAYGAGTLLTRLRRVPADAAPMTLLLVADAPPFR